ncbi:MAG: PAS domain-containing protein [Gemmatales bacterium]
MADSLMLSADSIMNTVREPMLVLSADLKVKWANHSFYRDFAVSPQATIDQLVYELGNGQWNIPKLRTLLEEVLPQNTSFDDFEVVHDFPSIGWKVMVLNARRVFREPNKLEYILLAFEDITDRRRLENGAKNWKPVSPRLSKTSAITQSSL